MSVGKRVPLVSLSFLLEGVFVVSTGPIEFLGEEPGHHTGSTEFGGESGLIQPRKAELLRGDPEVSGGHVLDERLVKEGISDARGVLHRAGSRVLSVQEQLTGVEDPAWLAAAAAEGVSTNAAIDPVTGRAVDVDVNGKGGEPGEFGDYLP